jgi:uncharacterized protein (DUF927 family)
MFDFLKSKKQKKIERLELMEFKNQEMRIKAERVKLRNQVQSAKTAMDRRKITQKISQIEDLTELKDYINDLFPDKKNEFLEILENPMVMAMIAQIFGKGLNPQQKQEKLTGLMEKIPDDIVREAADRI